MDKTMGGVRTEKREKKYRQYKMYDYREESNNEWITEWSFSLWGIIWNWPLPKKDTGGS